ncbi:1,4-alpha-glucan branching protein [Streptomyces sp. NPDC048717]|uniref:maltokinase N-terminal cap-like domain-containing protein n=1 Tax=Streptomyces sp. NPDC048717 TaxID=3154928 RepID=UPI003420F166
MSVIHRTTMAPTKLELLTAWLPTRPWYTAAGGAPELERTGGFRLDDPEGEVGIEFLVVTDSAGAGSGAGDGAGIGDGPRSYLVPMTYRAAPLPGAEEALIGTSEHGVLGTRWLYDGAHDPVLAGQLAALLRGKAEPQMQSVSHTPDPSVRAALADGSVPDGAWAAGTTVTATDGADATLLVFGPGEPVLCLCRVLDGEGDAEPAGALGTVSAEWHAGDGVTRRAPFVVVLPAAS